MTDETDTPAADNPPVQSADVAQVTLDAPINRGKQQIKTVSLRKPKAGELRGIALTDLMQMDYAAIAKVLPRVSDPVLTDTETANLDPADLVQLATELVGFLLPKHALQDN